MVELGFSHTSWDLSVLQGIQMWMEPGPASLSPFSLGSQAAMLPQCG